MKCVCGSERILNVGGKCSDMGSAHYYEGDVCVHEHDGYALGLAGTGNGDYLNIIFCAECGRIQSSRFPLSRELIDELFDES